MRCSVLHYSLFGLRVAAVFTLTLALIVLDAGETYLHAQTAIESYDQQGLDSPEEEAKSLHRTGRFAAASQHLVERAEEANRPLDWIGMAVFFAHALDPDRAEVAVARATGRDSSEIKKLFETQLLLAAGRGEEAVTVARDFSRRSSRWAKDTLLDIFDELGYPELSGEFRDEWWPPDNCVSAECNELRQLLAEQEHLAKNFKRDFRYTEGQRRHNRVPVHQVEKEIRETTENLNPRVVVDNYRELRDRGLLNEALERTDWTFAVSVLTNLGDPVHRPTVEPRSDARILLSIGALDEYDRFRESVDELAYFGNSQLWKLDLLRKIIDPEESDEAVLEAICRSSEEVRLQHRVHLKLALAAWGREAVLESLDQDDNSVGPHGLLQHFVHIVAYVHSGRWDKRAVPHQGKNLSEAMVRRSELVRALHAASVPRARIAAIRAYAWGHYGDFGRFRPSERHFRPWSGTPNPINPVLADAVLGPLLDAFPGDRVRRRANWLAKLARMDADRGRKAMLDQLDEANWHPLVVEQVIHALHERQLFGELARVVGPQLSLEEQTSSTLELLIDATAKLGRIDDALDVVSVYEDISASEFDVRMTAARTFGRHGHVDQALGLAGKAAKMKPTAIGPEALVARWSLQPQPEGWRDSTAYLHDRLIEALRADTAQDVINQRALALLQRLVLEHTSGLVALREILNTFAAEDAFEEGGTFLGAKLVSPIANSGSEASVSATIDVAIFLARAGYYDRAERQLFRLLSRKMERRLHRAFSELALARGEPQEALRWIEEALDGSDGMISQPQNLYTLGRVQSACECPAAASYSFERALTASRRLPQHMVDEMLAHLQLNPVDLEDLPRLDKAVRCGCHSR